jgi:hypothetical protein
VQQSPWLGIANKQMELMGRYMTELGMTPAARSRVAVSTTPPSPQTMRIEFVSACDCKPAELLSRTLDEMAKVEQS